MGRGHGRAALVFLPALKAANNANAVSQAHGGGRKMLLLGPNPAPARTSFFQSGFKRGVI